jgi:hypothetical protein
MEVFKLARTGIGYSYGLGMGSWQSILCFALPGHLHSMWRGYVDAPMHTCGVDIERKRGRKRETEESDLIMAETWLELSSLLAGHQSAAYSHFPRAWLKVPKLFFEFITLWPTTDIPISGQYHCSMVRWPSKSLAFQVLAQNVQVESLLSSLVCGVEKKHTGPADCRAAKVFNATWRSRSII